MKKSFNTSLEASFTDGSLLILLSSETTLAGIAEKLGFSAHGRNTGAITKFLIKNGLDFKNHQYKPIEVETRNCLHCNKEFSVSLHNKNKNKILTCSHACSGAYPAYIKTRVDNKIGPIATSYAVVAKRAGLTSCCICGESEVIDIHHIDEDRDNNELSNLAPLCPTHHAYMHRGKVDLIFDKLISYLDSRDL